MVDGGWWMEKYTSPSTIHHCYISPLDALRHGVVGLPYRLRHPVGGARLLAGGSIVATRRPAISDTELEVLRVLWERPQGTVREILEALQPQRRWAYTT